MCHQFSADALSGSSGRNMQVIEPSPPSLIFVTIRACKANDLWLVLSDGYVLTSLRKIEPLVPKGHSL